MGAGNGAGADSIESQGIPSWSQKSAFWFQTALLAIFSIGIVPLEPFPEPLSKPEKCAFAPGNKSIESQLFLGFHHQKCSPSKPYTRNPRRHPPNFIDFLPTNSSRKNPPLPMSRCLGGQVRSWRSARSGRSRSGSGSGRFRSGLGC